MCACELRRRELYGDGRDGGQRRWGDDADPHRPVGRAGARRPTAPRTPRSGSSRRAQPRRAAGAARRRCSSPAARGAGRSCRAAATSTSTQTEGRTLLTCSRHARASARSRRATANGEGLPVVVVDEEIYRLLPALVIATVDKFARMPWEGRVQSLFGQVSRRCERHGYLTPERGPSGQAPQARRARRPPRWRPCEPLRPPDLIIQDELHLISGPLGTWSGSTRRRSTRCRTWEVDGATRAAEGHRLDGDDPPRPRPGQAAVRPASSGVFPPPGLDARDTFFALQRDRPERAASASPAGATSASARRAAATSRS